MDLFPNPDQQMLADTAGDFAARTADPQVVRALEASALGYDHAHWATMVDLGWPGLGPVELALVVERLGRAALPSPLVVTGALRNALPDLATAAPDAVLTLAAVVPGATAEHDGPHPAAGTTVTGTYLLVPYAGSAALIVAATDRGLVGVDPRGPGVTLTRETVIGTDPLWRVDLTDAPARPVAGSLAHVLDHLAVASLAATVGAAEGALARSVRHAKDRHQFGRPIGSFQAVAHRCADMRAEVDACRVLAWRAAWALGRDADAGFAVASALAYAKDALRRVAMHAHQVHGAIGFSTEHDLHLFTRRIKAFELSGGSTAQHQERLAAALGLRA